MPLPNTVLAGAPKSGTSSCFHWLAAHPEVCGSSVKEPWYLIDKSEKRYTQGTNHYHYKGLDGYKQFFRHCKGEKIILEATPGYIYQQTAIDVLAALEPTPSILFILRDPAEQIFSLFRFNKYRTKGLKQNFDFAEYIDWLKDRSKAGESNALDRNKYILFLEKWLDAFPKENLHVYLFEDLKTSPQDFMVKISNALQIDTAFWTTFDFHHRNPTVEIKNLKLHKIGKKLQALTPAWLQEKVFLPVYFKLNSSKLPPVSEKDRQVIEGLREYFQPYNKQLAERFDLDLSSWWKAKPAPQDKPA